MKNLFLISSLLAVILFSACSHKPARLVLPDEPVDIGMVLITGDPVTFDVDLRNDGDDKLIIERVETTCNCTTVDYPTDSIPAGGSAVMHVTFSAKDFFPSEMTREIQIFTNTEASPQSFFFKVKVDYGTLKSDSCETYIRYSHS